VELRGFEPLKWQLETLGKSSTFHHRRLTSF
jgi:hypothetical protein